MSAVADTLQWLSSIIGQFRHTHKCKRSVNILFGPGKDITKRFPALLKRTKTHNFTKRFMLLTEYFEVFEYFEAIP